MTHKNRQLLDEYVLRLSDLQYKKRKKQEDFIIIGLFLIAFVELLDIPKSLNLTGSPCILSEDELPKFTG